MTKSIDELKAIVEERRKALNEAEAELRLAIIDASPFKIGALVSGGWHPNRRRVYRITNIRVVWGGIELSGQRRLVDGGFGEVSHVIHQPQLLDETEAK